jgi:hypothetical protein
MKVLTLLRGNQMEVGWADPRADLKKLCMKIVE